jgi:hypothetical protein
MDNMFARLEDLSVRINTTSDSISDTLKRLEAKLANLRLGVEVWLDEPLTKDPLSDKKGAVQETISTFLGYTKVNGTWHIAIRNNAGDILGDGPDENRVWPILQAPREERVAAVKRIPSLIMALEKKCEEELYQIASALESVDNLSMDVIKQLPKK